MLNIGSDCIMTRPICSRLHIPKITMEARLQNCTVARNNWTWSMTIYIKQRIAHRTDMCCHKDMQQSYEKIEWSLGKGGKM